MSGILKYISASLIFHGIAAAALLGTGVFTHAPSVPSYIEVTCIGLPGPEGCGKDSSVTPKTRAAGSRRNPSESAGRNIRRDSASLNDNSSSTMHQNKPLRYIVPDITEDAYTEPEGVMASPESHPTGTSVASGGRPDGCTVHASNDMDGSSRNAGGSGDASLGAGYINSGFGRRGGPGIIKLERPKYPPRAMSMNKGGAVVLRLVIDKDGSLRSVDVEKDAGYGFDEAAVEAALRSRFSPAVKDGRPVGCVALLPYRFEPAAR